MRAPLTPSLSPPGRRRLAGLAALALAVGVVPVVGAAAAAEDPPANDPILLGAFGEPFEEEGEYCVTDEDDPLGPRTVCKPAAASMVVMPNGRVLYWDALEGMEDVRLNVVGEFGGKAQNNQTRVLDLNDGDPRFATPNPFDGGANPGGNDGDEFLPLPIQNDDDKRNDGDLFCSDQVFLADGRVLVAGGTSYYLEPGISGVDLGVTELEGIKNARVFDPATNEWSQTGSMNYGRWYPSLVTLADGKVLATSGVTKLIKPVYLDRPEDSGTNVKQVETFDPATGEWTPGPAGSERSLPLYPRLHLLPNGKVYYDAAGQAFNPFGQSYDEALWNLAAVFDPETQTWDDLGVPQIGGLPLGFRGSGFSIMMPLQAPYDRADFLSAGGVLGVSPGSYLATDTTTLNSVDLSSGDEVFSSRSVGRLSTPRWYGTGVLLPNGQVVAVSGADRDEVVLPGSGTPLTQAELYDPETETWTPVASARKGRTYHNNAVLLPDGRVLLGGHAPIGTGYSTNTNLLRDTLGFSSPDRDPSFEVYSPPYLFWGDRPEIRRAPAAAGYGTTMTLQVDDASDISSVVVMRNDAKTHLIDSDQRAVELPIVARNGRNLVVQTPPGAAVAPAGPYTVFVNQEVEGKGTQPSEGKQMFIGTAATAYPDIEFERGAAPAGEESVPPPSEQRIPSLPGLPMLDTLGQGTDELVNPLVGQLPTEQVEQLLPNSQLPTEPKPRPTDEPAPPAEPGEEQPAPDDEQPAPGVPGLPGAPGLPGVPDLPGLPVPPASALPATELLAQRTSGSSPLEPASWQPLVAALLVGTLVMAHGATRRRQLSS